MRDFVQGLTPRDVQLAAVRSLRQMADEIERGEIDIRAMHFDQHPPDAAEGDYDMTLRCGPRRPLADQGITVSIKTTEG